MPTQRFSVRFFDSSGIGQTVDSDLRVDFFEEGDATTVKASRSLGADENANILASSDGLGTYYTTVLEVSGLKQGEVTAKWYAKLSSVETIPYPFVDTKCYPDTTMTTTEVELTNWIKRQLGYPQVVIELNDAQINDSINNALEDFDSFLSLLDNFALDVLPGTTRYGPYDEAAAGAGVLMVQFTDRFRNPHVHDPFFGISYLNELRGDFRTFVMANSFREMLERQDSEEPEWMWDPWTRYLMIHSPNTQYRGRVIVQRVYTMGMIPRQWIQKFRRLSLAYAKQILAKIRGKFDSIPAPGGAASNLDYNQLAQEAETTILEIHEGLQAAGLARVPMLWDRP